MTETGADHEHGADCSEVLLRLYEYLDGEMTADEAMRFATHLAECGACLAQHDMERAIKALVKRSCRCEPAPAPLRASIISSFTSVRIEYLD